MKSPHIALCIGHSRKIQGRRDGGAVSAGGVSEWDYNLDLASMIGAHLTRYGIRRTIIQDYQGGNYGDAMRWLAGHLKALGVDAAVELHFNSAGTSARGHEWLHWHTSAPSKALAESMDMEMRLQLPPATLPARGAKPIERKERGWQFLNYTSMPAIICEPFFGSNETDWKIATEQKQAIAMAIANGIAEWVD